MTSAILAVLLATQGNPVYQSTGSTPFEGGACDGQRVQISADDGTMFCCVSSVWERCGTAKGASVLLTQPHAAFPDGVAVSSIAANGFLVGHTGSGTISSYLGASCTLPQVVRVIGPTGAVTCSQPSNVTGNAATATALAANPADCAANEYAHTIAASGALTCSQVAYSQVSGTPTSLSGEPFVTTSASANLSNESVLPTCSGTDKLTFNGTTISCATDETTGGGSGYTTIQDEGSSLTAYTTLNFAGAGVTCADDTSKTTCTIPGGSGSPGGSTGQVQYNNSGAFGGASATTISSQGFPDLEPLTGSTAATAPSTALTLFSRKRAGKTRLWQIGPSGLDTPFQPHLAQNKAAYFISNGNSNSITLGVFGVVLSSGGTATARNVATTNFTTSLRRTAWVSSATAGSSSGPRSAVAQYWRGNVTGGGGFDMISRFWFDQTVTNWRGAIGMYGTTSAIGNVEPSALVNFIGAGARSTDTNMQIFHNDNTGTATAIDTGCAKPAAGVTATTDTSIWELRVFAKPNDTTVYFSLEQINPNQTACFYEGSTTTDIPSSTQLLTWQGYINNNATASAVGFALQSIYLETDY